MIISAEMFARLDAYGARPYSGRAMFGARCLGIVGLSQLLEAIRDVPELPISGWQHDSMGRDVIYYNPRIQIALEVVNDYYED